jgi:hypothetical protein
LGKHAPARRHRIAILRAMSQGASLVSYQHAPAKATGRLPCCCPALHEDKAVPVRGPHPDVVREQNENSRRAT